MVTAGRGGPAGTAACTALLAAVLGGCGPLAPDAAAAEAAAASFHAAVADGDGAAACGLLAPAVVAQVEASAGAGCAEAVLGADLPPAGVVVRSHAYGRGAQVVLDDDVVFLTASGGAWLVTAAGCAPRPERPYDCLVSAG